jgi:hypothetical protein
LEKDTKTLQQALNSGILALDILKNDLHRPLVNGKANRDNIEEHIVIGILSKDLDYFVDQTIVDLAIETIDDLILLNNKNESIQN